MSVNFCKNFVTLRKQNGYTQERIAEKCGVSRQAITKWKCGSSLPDMYKLVEIAKLFDVSIDDLICGNCYSPLKALPMMNELLERLLAKTENIERNISTAQDVSDELIQVYYDQLNAPEEERETWRYILEEHLDIVEEYKKSGYERAWDIIEALILLGEGTFHSVLGDVMELSSVLYEEYIPSGSRKSTKYIEFIEDFANILPVWSRILKHEIELERQRPTRLSDWPEGAI